ncbi:MAG: ABC transporter ATP-binding protein [Alphaproteobacteria bacterium]|nr:ABC transporter ATP-binding protein [Alphaproteobacteria bacterium]MBV9695109.1 ABC transporter ATP-binding protein [Alphaproteobacteria bacterium]
MSGKILEISNLDVHFTTPDCDVHAVKDLHLEVREAECLGVVGESGSGKSQAFLAAIGLLSGNGRASGSVKYRGQEILGQSQRALNRFRGSKITMIFQDPLTSLTPHMTIGAQLVETLCVHLRLPRDEAAKRALEVLELVRIPEGRRRMSQFPHELSGGMRQRVMIAMGVVCGPDLLIADEPTTALDVTVQAEILEIMRDLKDELKTSIVLVSHDMGVIAGMADRVAVMRGGEIVETGPVDEIYYAPKHGYTRMLLEAVPRLDLGDQSAQSKVKELPPDAQPILKVDDLRVHFPVAEGWRTKDLRAVDGVSFYLREGEALGIVGESGCGKSSLARALLKLLPKTDGAVLWLGRDLGRLDGEELRKLRRDFQIVFQDPLASLDPRMTVGESIAEPLRSLKPHLSREEIRRCVRDMMDQVGLEPAWINRYPHEFSGGQNQRVGVARAMIVEPKLVICDEAVSALDASIQRQMVDLIRELQSEFDMSLIFISHDLSVVRQIAHRVMVLYLGRIVELADRDVIYGDPRHPYTKALLSAVPIPDPKLERAKKRVRLTGELPSPLDSRAPLVFLKSKAIDDPEAVQYRPKLIEVAPGHLVAEHDAVT